MSFLGRVTRGPRGVLKTWWGACRLRLAAGSTPNLRIVVGSSGVVPRGWARTEIEYLNLLQPADWRRFFRPGSLDAILAEHVWEHLTPAEGAAACAVCFEYLRPGGRLRIAVPDGFHPSPEYREWVRPGGSGAGADDHKALYTHESLGRLLAEAGFEVDLLEYFDAAGQFHRTEWSPQDGMIHRSARFDERNRDGRLRYTSLIVDARKPRIS